MPRVLPRNLQRETLKGRKAWSTEREARLDAFDIAAVPHRRKPGKELTTEQKSVNRAHSQLRSPVEEAIARIKIWRILRKARTNPNKLTSIARAIITLETHR
ncbi:transposase family protein [Streptomyces chryseus]